MYSLLTPGWRAVIKGTLSLAWGLVALGGVSSAFAAPNAVIEEWPASLYRVGGVVLAVTCVVAVVGIVSDHYRIEWIAAWLAGFVFAPYVTTIWYLYFTGFPERLAGAWFNTALLVCLLSRVVSCAAHAARLRSEHVRVGHILDTLEATTGTVPTARRDDGAG